MSLRKLVSIFILAGLLFEALPSFAGGSRVGNGGDNGKSGVKIFIDKSYEIETPPPFIQIKEYPDGVKIEGPPQFKVRPSALGMSPRMQSQTIKISPLDIQRPEMSSLEKEGLVKYLHDRKWTQSETTDNCMVVSEITNQDYDTTVVAWGRGQGYMITADKTGAARKATDEIVKSTKPVGGCKWK